MGVVIPSGFAQITLLGFHGSTSQLWACTLGLSLAASPSASDVAGAGYLAWRDNVLPVQTTSTGLTSCLAKLGPNDLGPSAESGTLVAGGVDNPTLPSNVAVLVRKTTDAGGRPNRGRMFIPGMPEGSVSNGGIIDSGVLAGWQTALDGFLADLTGQLFIDAAVVLHDASSPVSTPTEIVSLDVQGLMATQRRRLRR